MGVPTPHNVWLNGRRYHAARVALLALACVLVVAALLMLAFTSSQLSRTQQVAAELVQSQTRAEVLVIASHSDSDAATQQQRDGLIDLLNRSQVAVDVEYLDVEGSGMARNVPNALEGTQTQYATGDTAAHGQALLQSAWGQALASKIANHNAYSVVICIDDDALCYVEAAHDALFSQTPVVFLGVNDATHAQRMFDLGYATGLIESADIAAFMNTVQAMRPSATSVLVVSDDTPTGIGYRAQLQAAAEGFSELTLTYVNASALSRADLAKCLSEAGEDTIVLYLNATTDSAGNAYTASQSAYFIAESAGQPVFSLCFNGVGEGFAGSTFVDYPAEGQRAGELIIMILNGTRPADIALETFISDGSAYDSTVLANYRINTSALPTNAATLHTSGLSAEALRPIFMPIMLLVLGIACLIAFAFLGYRRTASDMTDIVTQRNLLEQRFYTDSLTEMPNMQWLTAYAGSDASTRIRSIVEVMLLDFNHIDDLRGSGTADTVVKVLADRLNGLDKAFLVRPGSSEFILGVEHDLDASSPLLKKMERLLRRPIPLAGDSITVDPCIGVYNREPGMSIEEMVSGVDLAIRQAEQLGMNGEIIFYDADMRTAVEHKLDITTHIRRAIEKDGFIVVYQPQVDLASNEVVGYEALLRMRGDHYPPEQFIPVAEMNGQIVDIDRIVTKKVVGQLATWKKRKQRMRPVSINYGYGQLRDDDYIEYLVGLLDEQGVSHALIRMDIREGLFLNDMAKATGFVEELGEAGFSIAIDGFGAGLTQLSHINEIPADVVKIDRTVTASFFAGGDADVIANLVRLVHSANKLVVVEGVETLEQLQRCRAMGCDVVQGFFFSEPMLPEQAVRYKPAPLPPVPADLIAALQGEDAADALADEPESEAEPAESEVASTPGDEPDEPSKLEPKADKPEAEPDRTSRASTADEPAPSNASASTADEPAPSDASVADIIRVDADAAVGSEAATDTETATDSAASPQAVAKGAGLDALFGSTAAVEPEDASAHASQTAEASTDVSADPTGIADAADSLDPVDAAVSADPAAPADTADPAAPAAPADPTGIPGSTPASTSSPEATADSPADDLAASWATTPEEAVASFTAGPDGSAVIDIAFSAATDPAPESDDPAKSPKSAKPPKSAESSDSDNSAKSPKSSESDED